jgi:phage regulator Rha-like protein
MMEMQVTPETYVSWKKDLIKKFKELDKMYMTHVKTTHVELNTMHTNAMLPLTNLLESNLNFHYLEVIAKKKDVPNFRI